ncbi:efflux RND transporter periplasmic adaptor subunit [Actibacterium ureilyticum]|uniref:efflux RND transporter periplasmic adaptor subunit n=1 Tax=Actibacterium ureilyticum TaxID=1590614 RepID=UPI000BAACDAF|nr:efflux RND transporter periplasmic adaptor subunit [Actibacterium ureilyticum]
MRIVSILTACLVAVALYLLVLQRDWLLAVAGVTPKEPEAAQADATPADPEDAHRVSVVARRSQAQTVTGSVLVRGRTEAARSVEVRAETTGTVISAPLRKGAFVEAGQTLCQIDPGTREATLLETEARLAEARAGLPSAAARLIEAQALLNEANINDRAAARLRDDGYASETRAAATAAAVSSAEAGVEAAKSGLETAQSAIRAAEAAVASAKKEIERLTIDAPFAGLLETDSAELGSLLQAGTTCATVIQLDPIKLVGFLPETDIDKITLNSPVEARLASGRQVAGAVSFLSRSADETTRTFRVEADVENADLSIRDGQTAEIVMTAGEAVAHLLPQSALTLNDDGKIGVRIVDAERHAQFLPVHVLRDTVEGVWVHGLPEIADIIVIGQEFVTDGVPVAPTFRE